jgi:hypothetical protein
MIIDCDTCVVRHQACDDCVVGVLLGVPEVPAPDGEGIRAGGPGEPGRPREPAEPGAPLPVEFGPVERRALEVLADHGLIPHLRLVTATAPAAPGAPAAAGSGEVRAPARRGAARRRDVG